MIHILCSHLAVGANYSFITQSNINDTGQYLKDGRKILGGLGSSFAKYPFFARVWTSSEKYKYGVDDNSHFEDIENWVQCGGTILPRISGIWILTTAQCVHPRYETVIAILEVEEIQYPYRSRRNFRHNPGFNKHVYQIAQRMTHPQWKLYNRFHDIGLIRLYTPYNYPSKILVELPTRDEDKEPLSYGYATVMGVGYTQRPWIVENLPRYLYETNLPIRNNWYCRKRHSTFYGVFEMCVGGDMPFGLAIGDMGSPYLAQRNDGSKVLLGVHSYTVEDNKNGLILQTSYGPHLRHRDHLNWIKQQIGES